MSEQSKEVELPSKEELLGTDEDLGMSSGDEHSYSELEQQAIAAGWNPDQDAVEALGKDWVSAEIFMARQPMFDEIHKLRRALKNRDKDVDAIKQHLEMMRKKETEDSVKELKAKRREAMDLGDYDAVEEFEEQIEALKSSETSKKVEPEIPPEYIEWKAENTWYTTDAELTKYADLIGPGLLQEYSNDVEAFYKAITNEVKARFPEKFGKAKATQAAGAVESGKGKVASTKGSHRSSKKYSISDIPEGERHLAKTIISMIGEEAYFKDYFGE